MISTKYYGCGVMEDKKTLKAYTWLWGIITAVYGIWMALFMKWDSFPYIIPTDADMALPAEDFIAKFDGVLYEPLYSNAGVYWLWVIASTVLMLLYAVFVKKILLFLAFFALIYFIVFKYIIGFFVNKLKFFNILSSSSVYSSLLAGIFCSRTYLQVRCSEQTSAAPIRK